MSCFLHVLTNNVAGCAVVLFCGGKGVQLVPGASRFWATSDDVPDGRRGLLSRAVLDVAGCWVEVSFDVKKMAEFVDGSTFQFRHTTKLIVEISKSYERGDGVVNDELSQALRKMLCIQWPFDALSLSLLRALEDGLDDWSAVGVRSLIYLGCLVVVQAKRDVVTFQVY